MKDETPLQKAQRILQEKRKAGETLDHLDPIEKARKNTKSLRLAINAKCWDCSCGKRSEIKHCIIPDCPLYPVRPYSK